MADDFRRKINEGSRNASTKAPHFFTVILYSEPRLRLPQKFMRKYGQNIPRIICLETQTGPVWQVELTRTNGEAWLEKGFQEFKDYYSIGLGYFLVFRYDEDFYFNVHIYDTSAAEIDYPPAFPKQKHQHNSFGGACDSKKGRPIDDSVNSVEILPNDFSTKQNGKRKRQIVDGYPMCKTATELPENSCPQENKAAKISVALPNHRSKSFQNKRVKLETSQAEAVPPYLNREIKKECNASTRSHLQFPFSQSKHTFTKEEKEKFIAYRRAKAFKSKNPVFIIFIQPSYVNAYQLSIRKSFAIKYLSNEKCYDVVLRVPDGRRWKMKCCTGPRDAKLLWNIFVKDNGLGVGDVCVFERENDTKRPFLNVIVFRALEEGNI